MRCLVGNPSRVRSVTEIQDAQLARLPRFLSFLRDGGKIDVLYVLPTESFKNPFSKMDEAHHFS